MDPVQLMNDAQDSFIKDPSESTADYFLTLAKKLRKDGQITDRDMDLVYEIISESLSIC